MECTLLIIFIPSPIFIKYLPFDGGKNRKLKEIELRIKLGMHCGKSYRQSKNCTFAMSRKKLIKLLSIFTEDNGFS